MNQLLVIISGTPSIGKTTTAASLLKMFENSAHLDGDWLWNVNPFSLDDPRLRDGDKSMSFALSTYLKSKFDYVIFSSCITVDTNIRKDIINDIDYQNYKILGFTLICSKETLAERHYGQNLTYEPPYSWLEEEPHPGDVVINTDGMGVEEVCREIQSYIINR